MFKLLHVILKRHYRMNMSLLCVHVCAQATCLMVSECKPEDLLQILRAVVLITLERGTCDFIPG